MENLFGLSLDALSAWFETAGEKKFRGTQVYKWLYKFGADSFDDMTDLSKALREKLAASATIIKPLPVSVLSSGENGSQAAQKIMFDLPDGLRIESVYIPEDDRKTVCLSTQAGCALGCVFCATGTMGLSRNLTAGEIAGQLIHIRKHIDPDITNVVLMGMGEPFQNYDNTMTACEILTSQNGPGVGKKKITISTAGLVPEIIRYADERRQYSLAVSLNATDDDTRRKLMPIAKKYPLKELLSSLKHYNAHGRNRVTLEYVLISGVNDSTDDVKRLIKIVSSVGRCKVNVIVFNPVGHSPLRAPENETTERFMKQLSVINVPLTLRKSRGSNIAAACGQLAVKSNTVPSANKNPS